MTRIESECDLEIASVSLSLSLFINTFEYAIVLMYPAK